MDNREELILKELNYKINKNGTLLNPYHKEVGSISAQGYKKVQVTLYDKIIKAKKIKEVFIHRIQAFKKFGNKLYVDGIMVRHLDNNKLNNSWDNIGIGNAKDNYNDLPKENIKERQILATNASKKYSDSLVKEIKSFYKNNNNNQTAAMKKYNISSTGTLWYILNKR